MSEVTRILSAIEQGDPHAAERLLPLVYDELRRLAAQRLAPEAPRANPQTTAPGPQAQPRPGAPGPPLAPDALGPRAVPAPGRRGGGPAVEQPRPFLRRRRPGDAPHPRR